VNLFGAADPKRLALYAFLIGTLAVGTVASLFAEPNIAGWYAGLVKPPFAPPGWLFEPVLTALSVLMAVAAWRAWRMAGLSSAALTLYFLQLTLDFAWSLIFFAQHLIAVALGDVALLLITLVATAIAFFRADKLAGAMLLPCLAWTGFTAALNYEIWRLN
jgi:tryptophan-rich sensory protein